MSINTDMSILRLEFPVGSTAIWDQGGGPNRYRVEVVEHVGEQTLKIVIREVIYTPANSGQVRLAVGAWTYVLARNLLRPTNRNRARPGTGVPYREGSSIGLLAEATSGPDGRTMLP